MASNLKIPIDDIKIEVETRYLDNEVLKTIFIFSDDCKVKDTKINQIHSPVLQMYYWNNWNKWRG